MIGLLLTVCLLFALTGCANEPYDGMEEPYYGFEDAYILGKSYGEIVTHYGASVAMDDRISYRVVWDSANGNEENVTVQITFDDTMTATKWELVSDVDPLTLNIGTKRYPYDISWLIGKTASEIRERYGPFYREYRDEERYTAITNDFGCYAIVEGDGELGWNDQILFHIYFIADGVATRVYELRGNPGG